MKTFVLYHAQCWDGLVAAWVARSVLKGEVEYLPVQYGSPEPVLKDAERIYLLDFCYPLDVLHRWWDRGQSLQHFVICDHHETAEPILKQFAVECRASGEESPKIHFNKEKSGGRLSWEHFYGRSGCTSPGIVDYTEDRDLWRWKLNFSREVNACLRSYPQDFEVLDKYGHMLPEALIAEFRRDGVAILRSEQRIVDEHVANAKETNLNGFQVLAVNATVSVSEIAGALAKGRPFGACYFHRADGKRVWSLRSAEDGVNVAEVAKKYGGGGHAHAAGFVESVAFLPSIQIQTSF